MLKARFLQAVYSFVIILRTSQVTLSRPPETSLIQPGALQRSNCPHCEHGFRLCANLCGFLCFARLVDGLTRLTGGRWVIICVSNSQLTGNISHARTVRCLELKVEAWVISNFPVFPVSDSLFPLIPCLWETPQAWDMAVHADGWLLKGC